MLQINGLDVFFGSQKVLDGVTLSLDSGVMAGLIAGLSAATCSSAVIGMCSPIGILPKPGSAIGADPARLDGSKPLRGAGGPGGNPYAFQSSGVERGLEVDKGVRKT